MRKFILAVCAIALIVACDKDATVPTSEQLVGSWSLVQRTCSPSNVAETPTSLGHSVRLEISANGQARVRQGETIVTATTYQLSGSGVYHQIDFAATTFFGASDVNLVIANANSLTLQWQLPRGGCLALLTRAGS